MSADNPVGLDRAAVHALSNHVSVVLGCIEIVMAKTPADDPRHPDLVEIRNAAVQAAEVISRHPRRN